MNSFCSRNRFSESKRVRRWTLAALKVGNFRWRRRLLFHTFTSSKFATSRFRESSETNDCEVKVYELHGACNGSAGCRFFFPRFRSVRSRLQLAALVRAVCVTTWAETVTTTRRTETNKRRNTNKNRDRTRSHNLFFFYFVTFPYHFIPISTSLIITCGEWTDMENVWMRVYSEP